MSQPLWHQGWKDLHEEWAPVHAWLCSGKHPVSSLLSVHFRNWDILQNCALRSVSWSLKGWRRGITGDTKYRIHRRAVCRCALTLSFAGMWSLSQFFLGLFFFLWLTSVTNYISNNTLVLSLERLPSVISYLKTLAAYIRSNQHHLNICFADICYVTESLILVWCVSVEIWWKSCHACQVFSDMDGIPFHSISSTHVLMAQHLVYPLKWQCAIFADIVAKINFQRSLFIKSCCLLFNKQFCFHAFCWMGIYGAGFSLVQKYCFLWVMNSLK